jgi:hypothetical protein
MSEQKLPTVYVGPTTGKLGLVRFHHYIDIELNANIQAAITKYPVLKVLFIPLEQFGTRAPDIYAGREAIIDHAVKQLVKDGAF